MKKYKFSCGCEFDVLDEEKLRIDFNPDITQIPMDCQRTWQYICDGDTQGIFQLEQPLGKAKSRELKPRNIEQAAALIAVMRPGSLEAILEGKSVTKRYIDRLHGEEMVTYYHSALEPSLKETFGLLVYQEQAIRIVQDIAGFDLVEADILRRAIGKKKSDTMSEVENLFVTKAKEIGIVSEEEAKEIFSWIRKAERYSFNKSHAVTYAINGYLSAYCKAHFTRPFFTSWLFHSKDKNTKQTVEIRRLVNNAKMLDIDVVLPDFRTLFMKSDIPGLNPSLHFYLRDKKIHVGFSDIKGVGQSSIQMLIDRIPTIEEQIGVTYDKWAWEDFLLFCSPILNKTTVEAFIEVGCFDYMVPSRNKMLHEYETLKKLRGKELSGIQQKYLEFKTSLTDCIALILQDGSGKGKSISSVVRKAKLQDMEKVLRKPPRSLVDTPEWVAGTEESLLGISITYAKVDSKDIGAANCTCKDFRDTIIDYFIIAGEITNVNEVKTKRGKNPGQDMAFLTVNDSTGALDNVVVFPESWENNKSLLIESNLVMIGGKKGKENSFILEKVWQI